MRTRSLFVALTSLLVSSATALEPVTTSAFHDAVEKIRVARKVPAVGVLVARGDQILARDVWGTVAADSGDLMKLDDAWHIGSDTKAMTATIAARLIERGKLKWETTLGEACPELKARINAGWAGITLASFLTQSAGVPASLEGPVFIATMRGMDTQTKLSPRERRAGLIAKVLTAAPPRKPGEKYEYANLNYIIAGHMLESVMNTDWEDLIQTEVFTPLGMTTAGFGPPPRVRGHANGKPLMLDNAAVLGPAGAVHLSLDDWLKFTRVHAGVTPGYLAPASLEKLHTPALENYAMGWIVVPRPDKTVALTHDGSNTLFRARAILRPDAGVVVLIALSVDDPAACDQITTAAATAFLMPAAHAPAAH